MNALTGTLLGLGMGVLSGLGVGGGKLLIPALVVAFAVPQQTAQGLTLAAFLPIASMASVVHYRQGNVLPEVALAIGAGGVLGALVGAWAATLTASELLSRLYGYFLLAAGIYELVTPAPPPGEAHHGPGGGG